MAFEGCGTAGWRLVWLGWSFVALFVSNGSGGAGTCGLVFEGVCGGEGLLGLLCLVG